MEKLKQSRVVCSIAAHMYEGPTSVNHRRGFLTRLVCEEVPVDGLGAQAERLGDRLQGLGVLGAHKLQQPEQADRQELRVQAWPGWTTSLIRTMNPLVPLFCYQEFLSATAA